MMINDVSQRMEPKYCSSIFFRDITMRTMKVLNIISFVILGLSFLATIIATTTPGWIVGTVTVKGEALTFEASLLHIYINNNITQSYNEVEEILNPWIQNLPEGAGSCAVLQIILY